MIRQGRVSGINVGDSVKFSESFLVSIHEGKASPMKAGRGVMTDILTPDKPHDRAMIDWQGADLPERVILSNLAKVSVRVMTDD